MGINGLWEGNLQSREKVRSASQIMITLERAELVCRKKVLSQKQWQVLRIVDSEAVATHVALVYSRFNIAYSVQ
jgi:hypothetical protein